MGIIKRTRVVEEVDLWRYKPEFNPDGTEKHVFQEGARYHVLSFHGFQSGLFDSNAYRVCSCKNCEINKKERARMIKESKYDILTRQDVK